MIEQYTDYDGNPMEGTPVKGLPSIMAYPSRIFTRPYSQVARYMVPNHVTPDSYHDNHGTDVVDMFTDSVWVQRSAGLTHKEFTDDYFRCMKYYLGLRRDAKKRIIKFPDKYEYSARVNYPKLSRKLYPSVVVPDYR